MRRAFTRSGLRWGSAQEAAALAAVLQALPNATIEEAGLVMLDVTTLPPTLPQHARTLALTPNALPPIGASPDAMMRRHPSAPLEAVEVRSL
eukprot:1552493-Pleurochrysis_carterae.AAC.1